MKVGSEAIQPPNTFELMLVANPAVTRIGAVSPMTLAIARVIGETAPILVTAGFATSINTNVFSGWMASLPTFIYTQILNPTSPANPDPSSQRAWGAALVLIILVMILNLGARLIARIFAPKTGR